jgi:hypothetical protein
MRVSRVHVHPHNNPVIAARNKRVHARLDALWRPTFVVGANARRQNTIT